MSLFPDPYEEARYLLRIPHREFIESEKASLEALLRLSCLTRESDCTDIERASLEALVRPSILTMSLNCTDIEKIHKHLIMITSWQRDCENIYGATITKLKQMWEGIDDIKLSIEEYNLGIPDLKLPDEIPTISLLERKLKDLKGSMQLLTSYFINMPMAAFDESKLDQSYFRDNDILKHLDLRIPDKIDMKRAEEIHNYVISQAKLGYSAYDIPLYTKVIDTWRILWSKQSPNLLEHPDRDDIALSIVICIYNY